MNSRREVAKIIVEQGEVEVYARGNFTVVLVHWHDMTGVGVSKRNPSDTYSYNLGLRKARGRALKDIADYVWEQEYKRLYEAGWISPGVPGTISSNGAGKRFVQWMHDCESGKAAIEDYDKDLTPIVSHDISRTVWK